MTFEAFFDRATRGCQPYDYQRRLADDGLPDVLRAPTGTGKTAAAVLPWLYRRRHADAAVRGTTPRRLVFVLPQRSLVEQTVDALDRWLKALDEKSVARHVLMGGVDRTDREWKTRPHEEAIFVGTQDMVLSRLLMRGYAEPRTNWPMSFGLLHADTQFVFDEVQLMGPALPTSLQLEGLRADRAAIPCRSMWMSATLDVSRIRGLAPDLDRDLTAVELSEADCGGPLQRRLDATRRLARIDIEPKRYAHELASHVVTGHRAGTRTLVVLNTVARATEVFDAIARTKPQADLVLLHSRYRPGDRAARTGEAVATPGAAGTIVVSTQVLEAGMDVTSELLVTELAPWSSVVQRAGRCNRDGSAYDARILWTPPPPGREQHLPYEQAQLDHAAEVLAGLENAQVTSTQLQGAAQDLGPPVYPVLRRRDLVDLFDTAPDLDGNDIDVTQWIRDSSDRTISLAWRDLASMSEDAPFPGRDELCPAPLTKDLRELVAGRQARVYDQRTGRWQPAQRDDVRPNAVVVLDASAGGYLADRGLSLRSAAPVEPVAPEPDRPAEAVQTDPLSLTPDGRWIGLTQHLVDVEREVNKLLTTLDPPGVTDPQRHAAALAARYHDLGKAHPTFEASLRRSSGEPDCPGPWAKSPGRGPLRHQPPHFRHELVSALLTLDRTTGLLDGVAEPDLVTYLVLAHHGKVRLSVRGRPDEPSTRVLGVSEGDNTLAIRLPNGRELGPQVLSVVPTRMGDGGLTARAIRLRDRPDLGPFRLAFLEALVRAADWIASASYDGGGRA